MEEQDRLVKWQRKITTAAGNYRSIVLACEKNRIKPAFFKKLLQLAVENPHDFLRITKDFRDVSEKSLTPSGLADLYVLGVKSHIRCLYLHAKKHRWLRDEPGLQRMSRQIKVTIRNSGFWFSLQDTKNLQKALRESGTADQAIENFFKTAGLAEQDLFSVDVKQKFFAWSSGWFVEVLLKDGLNPEDVVEFIECGLEKLGSREREGQDSIFEKLLDSFYECQEAPRKELCLQSYFQILTGYSISEEKVIAA